MTDWASYCGLSELINALVGAGLIAALRRRDAAAIGFGLLVLAKVLVESVSGTALLTDTSWPAVPMAHLAGILAGILAGLGAEFLTGVLLSVPPCEHLLALRCSTTSMMRSTV